MKISTIQKYISLMESMLDSDALSLEDFCNKNNVKVGTFRVQLTAIKKEVNNYYEECTRAIKLWEQVKEHFRNNRNSIKTIGIEAVAKDNVLNNDSLQWDGKEDPAAFNERVIAEINRLKGLLIKEEDSVPEIPSFDENFWDNLNVLNYK